MEINIREGTVIEAEVISRSILEFKDPYPVDEYIRRIDQVQYLVLVAEADDAVVGFKVGYALDTTTFYSWMGGVSHAFRGLGIAQRLLDWQEAWVVKNGYKQIHVKTLNRHRGMRALLLKNGYDVIGFEEASNNDEHRIMYSKYLPHLIEGI